jgi:DNA mismatch repair ATPase MutS
MSTEMIDEYFRIFEESVKKYGEKTTVMYAVGSFYEIYSVKNDKEQIGNAETVANIINCEFSNKNKVKKAELGYSTRSYCDFCGFVIDKKSKFVPLLLNENYTVVEVDQLEDAKTKKGKLVKRGVVAVHSPTLKSPEFETIGDSDSILCNVLLEYIPANSQLKTKNILLFSICSVNNVTNEIDIYESSVSFDNLSFQICLDELNRILLRYNVKELRLYTLGADLSDDNKETLQDNFKDHFNINIERVDPVTYKDYIKPSIQNEYFKKVYKNIEFGLLSPIEYFNLSSKELSVLNLMYTFDFMGRHSLSYLSNLSIPVLVEDNKNLVLALNTLVQLNILPQNSQNKNTSIFDVINNTSTAIGRRYLRNILSKPFKDPVVINERYDLTESLRESGKDIQYVLSSILDFERLHRKMSLEALHPYEFEKLDKTYKKIIELVELLDGYLDIVPSEDEMNVLGKYIDDYEKTFDLSSMRGISLNTTRENMINFFNKGQNLELDKIVEKIGKIEQSIEDIRQSYERCINDTSQTMIKLEYTDQDGYFLKCTKIRFEKLKGATKQKITRIKQTNNDVKFYPDELTKLSLELINNRELLAKKVKLNYISKILDYSSKFSSLFGTLKHFIEVLDVTHSNLKNSIKYNYCKPSITPTLSSFIKCHQLRHPIIERISSCAYITNDLTLDSETTGALVYGLNACGKCVSPLTKIMMFDGSRKLAKDIIRGDKLMGDNFDCKNVLSTTKGIGQMYKIIPVKGESFECNGPHMLSLKSSGYKSISWDNKEQRYRVNWIIDHINKSKSFSVYKYKTKDKAHKQACEFMATVKTDKGSIIDISVDEYLKKPSIWKQNYYLYRVPVEFDSKEVSLDPYLLGYWLGDGTSSKPEITTDDLEIVEYFKSILEQDGMIINVNNKCSYSIRGEIYGNNNFLKDLRKYNVLNNKHIPLEYLRNNKQIRLKVLAGLLDSDGFMNQGISYDITQKNEKLLDDIIELTRSLGLTAYKSKVMKTCFNSPTQAVGTYYQCHIAGTQEQLMEIPVLLERKKNYTRKVRDNSDITSFKVEKLEISDYCGFEVDGNHRFLLNDYTVTHNSSLLRGVGVNLILAQAGLYTSCTSFEYSPFSILISQVDLTDNLFSGKSSFINEMIGLRKILSSAGKNTLCLADEMCKGTESASAESIVTCTILELVKKDTKFFFTSHLHRIPELINDEKKVRVCHLSVDIKNDNIIFNRKLKDGSGPSIYGLEVCKSIISDRHFIDEAFKVRNKITGSKTNIVSNKRSNYNKKKTMDNCQVCGYTPRGRNSIPLDTHHIQEQKEADSKGFVKGEHTTHHKNEIYNLVTLCKDCHRKIDTKELIIFGYKDTTNGIFLDFELINN